MVAVKDDTKQHGDDEFDLIVDVMRMKEKMVLVDFRRIEERIMIFVAIEWKYMLLQSMEFYKGFR
jgi:hypothetical protein